MNISRFNSDCFDGIACMNTERKCILVEMDKDIFNILEKRITEHKTIIFEKKLI